MSDFERTTIPQLQVLTTAEAKSHLRVDLADDDVLIEDLIATATAEVEAYAVIALLTQDIVATFDGPFSAGRIRLPIGPVASDATAVVTVVSQDGTETELTASQFRLATGKAPAVWIIDNLSQPSALSKADSTLRVEYSAGYGTSAPDVPADLRHAVKDQVAHLYEQRGGYGEPRHAKPMSSNAIRLAQRYRRSSV